ncbi:hypothetical protein [Comamonas sp. JC664]|uniref:hypothetical protein n=1 Tax=Comamonas sp. JC664 TaxID=2801917 RepID=UPI00174A29B6|nr:hypothetical protein [Comamonas sp. JC664]MBL0695501.1 hypothetical protein [Comamonas sp. JC664]GHG61866.1 hypothetical protein GCM10012319_00110 [Comamonas sp. KCTC 72670]
MLHEFASQRALLEEHLVRRSREDARVPCVAGAGAVSELAPGALAQLKTELVQAVRDELALRSDEAAFDAETRAPAPEPSAQSLVALQEGHQLIDHAVRALRWTNEDRQTLRRAMVQMTHDQQVEVLRRLSTSLSGKEVDLQTQGAPF